jgi:hypothetical protein
MECRRDPPARQAVMRLFRRQFVLARHKFAFDETWRHADWRDGWILSHQADLAVHRQPASGSDADIVLGYRLCHDPTTGRGAGRYVALAWPQVRTDPAALLGVFYAERDGQMAISSSPELAAHALYGEHQPADVALELEHRRMINYIPAPGCRWSTVRRLLPDQAIDLASGQILAAGSGIQPLPSFDAAVDAMSAALCAFATELQSRIPGRVYLPLSAGLDSRTLAAAFLAAGLPFDTTTMRFAGKPMADVRISHKISRRLGLRHHIMEAHAPDPAVAALLDRHISGAYSDWDLSHLIPGDAYRYQQEGDAMIPGACFEVGYMYDQIFADVNFNEVTGTDLWRRCNGAGGSESLAGTWLDEWLSWRRAHPQALSWSAQFYLDQRLGAWRSSLEQGYDLLPAVSLNPANHIAVLSALITPSQEERQSRRLQMETVRRLAPELMKFPINPPPFRTKLRGYRRAVTGMVRRRFPWLLPSRARS